MKKCIDCNEEMIDNCKIEGYIPFTSVSDTSHVDITLNVPTGETGSFLGMKYNKTNKYQLKSRVCPKCGKVENYIDVN